MPDFWVRTNDWAKAPAQTVQDRVLGELTQPGAMVHIRVDAYWEKPGAYRRAFAGIADRGVALGAARIGRLAQCPVVPFVAVLGRHPRTVTIDWGNPIGPRAIDDKASDVETIDEALNFLEAGVARYPDQYLHPSGGDRHWDAAAARWVSASQAT